MANGSLDSVLDAIASAERDTDVDHVFLEMMNHAHTVDQVMRTARR